MVQAGSSVTIETTVNGDGQDGLAVDLQDNPSVAVYRRACEEARETIDQQIAWNREIDDKAARLLRINVALAALVVTALSLGLQYVPTDGGAGPPQRAFHGAMNWYFAAGTALFVTSTALAGATYTMSSLKVGLQFDGIDGTTESELPVEEFYRELALGYEGWADHNRRVVNRNGTFVSGAILSLVYSVVFFVVGVTNELGFGGLWKAFGALVLLFITIAVRQNSGRDSI